jgi:hypothetical protein
MHHKSNFQLRYEHCAARFDLCRDTKEIAA